jgi:hypothetical protein
MVKKRKEGEMLMEHLSKFKKVLNVGRPKKFLINNLSFPLNEWMVALGRGGGGIFN